MREVNPYTNSESCPTGYTQYTVLGTPNLDWYLYYCLKNLGTTMPTRDFGGIWGMGSDVPGNTYKNPVTNSASCPAGYTVKVGWGTDNFDWLLRWCYKPDANVVSSASCQSFTYPVRNDGYVKDDTASANKYCTEK